MEKKTIGTFIAALRKVNGLTQRQLAERLNVSDKAVSRWERDESAPDLTLIPVIAEIFGITSDELLRGERAAPNADPDRAAAKADKQIQRILKDTLTKYKIRSLISAAIALVGLIAAMIGNLGFLRGYIGFFAGCIFFIAAAVCQSIFMILGFSALDQDILDDALVASSRKALVYGAELVFGLIGFLFTACLPLILFSWNTYVGLELDTWAVTGLVLGLLAVLVGLLVSTFINRKLGYWQKTNWKSPENRLRLRWLARGMALAITVVILHITSALLLSQNYHMLIGGQKFDDWDNFRRHMETPTDTDGTPLTFRTVEGKGDNTLYIYENQSGGTVVFQKSAISKQIYRTPEAEEAGNVPLVRYRHLNKNAAAIKTNNGDLPVQVFTQSQMRIAEIMTTCLHLLWCIVYIMTLRRTILQYRAEKSTL